MYISNARKSLTDDMDIISYRYEYCLIDDPKRRTCYPYEQESKTWIEPEKDSCDDKSPAPKFFSRREKIAVFSLQIYPNKGDMCYDERYFLRFCDMCFRADDFE